MTKPQQPDATPPTGVIPEDNLPGHHPLHEQDKPEGPPPRPRPRGGTATKAATQARQVEGQATATLTDRRDVEDAAFRFRFGTRVGPAAYLFGITPWTTRLAIEDGELRVRFGAWQMRTPLANVESAEITGPYHWLRVAGPPHISLRDRGITMATSTERGVCIRFKEPVSALLPKGLLTHPALTVTVEDPERLVRVLTPR